MVINDTHMALTTDCMGMGGRCCNINVLGRNMPLYEDRCSSSANSNNRFTKLYSSCYGRMLNVLHGI